MSAPPLQNLLCGKLEKMDYIKTSEWNEYKPSINLDCIKNSVNSRFNFCCNELKVKYLVVSKQINYDKFLIYIYHDENKLGYINCDCGVEIYDKKKDRLYRNKYLQDKEYQNTMKDLQNEIKEHVNKYKQN